jgi:hypothetical protein
LTLFASLLVPHRAKAVADPLLLAARPKGPAVGQALQKKDHQEQLLLLGRVLPEYQERNLAVAEHLAVAADLKGYLLPPEEY